MSGPIRVHLFFPDTVCPNWLSRSAWACRGVASSPVRGGCGGDDSSRVGASLELVQLTLELGDEPILVGQLLTQLLDQGLKLGPWFAWRDAIRPER